MGHCAKGYGAGKGQKWESGGETRPGPQHWNMQATYRALKPRAGRGCFWFRELGRQRGGGGQRARPHGWEDSHQEKEDQAFHMREALGKGAEEGMCGDK